MPYALKPVSWGRWDSLNDHRYGDASSNQVLDLMVPRNGAATNPLIVIAFGGGWEGGNEAAGGIPLFGAQLCQRGFAVASIRYRLSGEARWPAQIQDVLSAIRELRARAGVGVFRLDPARFCGVGFSAGGQLIAEAAVAGDDPAFRTGRHPTITHELAAVLCDYPPTDFRQWVLTPGFTHLQAPSSFVSRLFGQPVLNIPQIADAASPALRVTPSAPPMWLRHGTADTTVPIAQSRKLRDAYIAAGIGARCTLTEKAGAGHAASSFYTSSEMTKIGDWFRDRL